MDNEIDTTMEKLFKDIIIEIERLKREVFYLKWMCDNRDRTVKQLESKLSHYESDGE